MSSNFRNLALAVISMALVPFEVHTIQAVHKFIIPARFLFYITWHVGGECVYASLVCNLYSYFIMHMCAFADRGLNKWCWMERSPCVHAHASVPWRGLI